MSSSHSPCAACKLKRQKCTKDCVFAPYFPPDQPQKFANIYEVFGAKNMARLLNELSPQQRQDAVDALAFEAEERLKDPVFGCVGHISVLQHKVKHVQNEILSTRTEIAKYMGPQAMIPMVHQTTPFMPQPFMGASSSSTMAHHQHGMMPFMEIQTAPVFSGPLINREPQQQQQPHQILHPHHHQPQQFSEEQVAVVMGAHREQHDTIRASEKKQQYHHQQVQQQKIQQQDFFGFNRDQFKASGSGPVTAIGFNQIGSYQIEPEQQQLQTQFLFQPQQEQQMTMDTQQKPGSDEEMRIARPSC